MEIRIGIVQSMKELDIELPEGTDRDEVIKDVEAALEGDRLLWLVDRRGRRVGIPAARIAYVEFTSTNERIVGFGAA
jgi:hypothetical protein